MGIINELVEQLHIKTQVKLNEENVFEDLTKGYSVFLKNNSDVSDKKMLEEIYSLGVMNNADRIINTKTGRINPEGLKVIQADVDKQVKKYKIELQRIEEKKLQKEQAKEVSMLDSEVIEAKREMLIKMIDENPEEAKKIIDAYLATLSKEEMEEIGIQLFDDALKKVPKATGAIKRLVNEFCEGDSIGFRADVFIKEILKLKEELSEEELDILFEAFSEYFEVNIIRQNDDIIVELPSSQKELDQQASEEPLKKQDIVVQKDSQEHSNPEEISTEEISTSQSLQESPELQPTQTLPNVQEQLKTGNIKSSTAVSQENDSIDDPDKNGTMRLVLKIGSEQKVDIDPQQLKNIQIGLGARGHAQIVKNMPIDQLLKFTGELDEMLVSDKEVGEISLGKHGKTIDEQEMPDALGGFVTDFIGIIEKNPSQLRNDDSTRENAAKISDMDFGKFAEAHLVEMHVSNDYQTKKPKADPGRIVASQIKIPETIKRKVDNRTQEQPSEDDLFRVADGAMKKLVECFGSRDGISQATELLETIVQDKKNISPQQHSVDRNGGEEQTRDNDEPEDRN